MKKSILVALCLLSALAFAEKKKTSASADRLHGTWCTGEEGMMLRFSVKDSLFVTSASDESVQGRGKYTRTDSTFAATLQNGETTLALRYLYRWKGTDTVEAKATLFTINGEVVEHPEEWMNMVRCGGNATKP